MNQTQMSLVLASAILTLSLIDVSNAVVAEETGKPVVVSEEAKRIHDSAILFDGHNDLPWRFRELGMPSFEKVDIAKRLPNTHTDIPRLREGGVKAQYWSVYVPVSTGLRGEALLTTLEQIDFVDAMLKHYPDTFELALTATDVERISKSGKIASLIGVEGGHSIENSLGALRQLYKRGARYMTLTHSTTLDWADSATDAQPHQGLTPFGERVISEMNRLGMIVDISHVSVECMKDALRLSKAPVMFSHSSARAIADHPRNVPDEVLKLTAKNNGIVMVNFYPSFVVPESAKRSVDRFIYKAELEKTVDNEEDRAKRLRDWEAQHPINRGDVHIVVDHIDHIAKTASVEHVGLGGDYDGIDAVPDQLEDVSAYPRITQLLLDRGYSAVDIRKILGGNAIRVLRDAEKVALEMRKENQ